MDMATDFGFLPSRQTDAFFISYSTTDASRIAPIVRDMNSRGVPLWYDYGLEYGREWEKQITEHIAACRGVILFMTKQLLQKKGLSYVRMEYDIARKDYDKTVYVALLDDIGSRDVIPEHKMWWREISYLHCITNATAQTIMTAIGYTVADAPSSHDSMTAEEYNRKGDDYYYGRNGVTKDYAQAVRYYRLAADQGSAKAQCNLGFCYANGQGVPQNREEAIRLYRLSAAQGNETAKYNLRRLGVE